MSFFSDWGSKKALGILGSSMCPFSRLKGIKANAEEVVWFAGYAGHRFEETEGASQESNPGCITASMNSSGPLSMVSTNEYFASGGLTYWESQERSREHRDSEEESDNLYGNELAAFQARHR